MHTLFLLVGVLIGLGLCFLEANPHSPKYGPTLVLGEVAMKFSGCILSAYCAIDLMLLWNML